MLESEDQPPSEIAVALVIEDEMRQLNASFRNVDAATDVLSFPAGEGPELSKRKYLGDIAICEPIAREQAQINDTPMITELACLAVHGGLHLLGYDDDSEAGLREMNEKMNKAVRAAGLIPVEEWESTYSREG